MTRIRNDSRDRVTVRASAPAPKGRPPLRKCPDDFDVIFVEQGRVGCEAWYRARRDTINRWMAERGKQRLIDARAAFVAHQRANGQWMTRSTRLVEIRPTGQTLRLQAIRDRRKVSPTLARHAAQFLRISRNGSYIVSMAQSGDWWVGSRRLSAAQMLDLAVGKGFDPDVVIVELDADPASRMGDFHARSSRLADKDKMDAGKPVRLATLHGSGGSKVKP